MDAYHPKDSNQGQSVQNHLALRMDRHGCLPLSKDAHLSELHLEFKPELH